MSNTPLAFAKIYEMDELYFTRISCMIRHEFQTHRSQYQPSDALDLFVADMSKWGWDGGAEMPIDMFRYCGRPYAGSVFLQCIKKVKVFLENCGDGLPSEYLIVVFPNKAELVAQNYSARKFIYWLDQIIGLIENYQSAPIQVTLPYPP
jgi:hypothetical protein